MLKSIESKFGGKLVIWVLGNDLKTRDEGGALLVYNFEDFILLNPLRLTHIAKSVAWVKLNLV